jgi:hypothetical protein
VAFEGGDLQSEIRAMSGRAYSVDRNVRLFLLYSLGTTRLKPVCPWRSGAAADFQATGLDEPVPLFDGTAQQVSDAMFSFHSQQVLVFV